MENNKIKVHYKNELNTVPMRDFSSLELNLFFSICSKMKNKGVDTVRFDFEELRDLSKYKRTAVNEFADDLNDVYSKMLNLTYGSYTNSVIERFVLFTGFKIDKNNQYVEISVNPKLEYIINNLSSEFTKFELDTFTKLRSTYAKTMFRMLKQFRSTGIYKVPIEKFREDFDIPKTYQMGNIDQRVLKPIKEELSEFYERLEIRKLKQKKRNKITHIEVIFKEKEKPKVPLHNWLDDLV